MDNRTSTTVPTRWPAASTTRSPRNLLSCMSASRDVANYVVPQPPLHPVHVKGLIGVPELDHHPNRYDQLPRDLLQQRPRWRAAEDARGHHPARQKRGYLRCLRPRCDLSVDFNTGQFQVVDDSDGVVVFVEHLSVQ